MNGVTILNSYEYLTNFGSVFIISALCVWFFTVVVLVLLSLLKYGCDSWKGPVFLVICVVLTIVCGFIPERKYEIHYQVTVDNSVSMNEFQDKYEIIEVEGKIYTVRERVE